MVIRKFPADEQNRNASQLLSFNPLDLASHPHLKMDLILDDFPMRISLMFALPYTARWHKKPQTRLRNRSRPTIFRSPIVCKQLQAV